ncbi:ATP-binding cassette domain-containing protein [Methanomethylophilus alvi]|uniref:ATP-binding cassette domain-containing protein n=1 Tax=Methanomethylophilus alvi TaxID=1291540 RepID=UPI0037DD0BB0
MDKNNSVEVKDLYKKFDVKHTTRYGGQAKSGTKRVLNGLSFSIKCGEVFGVIGRNGSGKSTLLKLLAGIMYPDSGTMELRGRVASILELGMGFEPEMTGRDNIRIKCKMYGLNDKEIDQYEEEIVQFSELGEQVDYPLRTYSSGMTAKLAFAVLIHVKCDILIIDEVLSVGDASFNYKCKLVFERMRKEKKTIILASHNMTTLEDLCDEIMWIDNGISREIGNALSVCHHFHTDSTESPITLENLANSGDTISMNRLAILYRDGINVDKDITKAKELFRRASDMGNLDAKVNLGDILASEGNDEESKKLFLNAADKGNQDAIIRVYSKNNDMAEKAIVRLKELAEKGNSRAIFAYADALNRGIGTKQDHAEATKWFLKAAEEYEDINAMYILGLKYRDGIGIPKNTDEGLKWLSSSSEMGNIRATIELANMYRRGIGVERNTTKCIEMYEKAAKMGDSNSMLQIATIYRDGQGVEKDAKRAQEWATLFAEYNRLKLENTLADILLRRYNSEEDRLESFMWFMDCAKNGYIDAEFQIGIMYRDGVGIEANSSEAAKWFTMASESNHIGALIELSNMYLKGNGIERSPEKAFALMKKASNYRNPIACLLLGKMILGGIGTKVDKELAGKYLEISAEHGNIQSILEKDRIRMPL